MPGCTVASRHCGPHHIIYWHDSGRTDLDNLVPLCGRHHHNAHEGGRQLTLTPDGTLTITYPDGTIQTTGPPARQGRHDPDGSNEPIGSPIRIGDRALSRG